MDDIRKNILQQREMQKARLCNHFAKAFDAQSSANGKDIDYAASQGAKEVKQEVEDEACKAKETSEEQKKVEKVMREFKEGELHSGSKEGKKVTNRKQAVAIALSEAGVNKAEIGDIEKGGDRIWNGEEWVSPEQFLFSDDLEKARTSKYQVGDVHPNGKWVWTEWAPGKFDWKSKNGKHHKGKASTAATPSQTVAGSTNVTSSNNKTTTTSNTKVDDEAIDQAKHDEAYKQAMSLKDRKKNSTTQSSQSQSKAKQDDKQPTIPKSLANINIIDIPDKEYKEITRTLEKVNPSSQQGEMQFGDMTDKEVANFLACAKYFKKSKKINTSTQERCAEWEDKARTELLDRIKQQGQKKQDDKKTTTKKSTADVLGIRAVFKQRPVSDVNKVGKALNRKK